MQQAHQPHDPCQCLSMLLQTILMLWIMAFRRMAVPMRREGHSCTDLRDGQSGQATNASGLSIYAPIRL